MSDLSDYSNGPKWNSQNIARHNSSRVWGTVIVGNTFNAPARVVVRGAKYLSFGDNNCAAGVSFDIRSSDNVELDGADSKGPVRYLLRAGGEELADYRIEAASGAELSMTGSDRVSLTGHRRLMSTGADFRLHFDGGRARRVELGSSPQNGYPQRSLGRSANLAGFGCSNYYWVQGNVLGKTYHRDEYCNLSLRPVQSKGVSPNVFEREMDLAGA